MGYCDNNEPKRSEYNGKGNNPLLGDKRFLFFLLSASKGHLREQGALSGRSFFSEDFLVGFLCEVEEYCRVVKDVSRDGTTDSRSEVVKKDPAVYTGLLK